MNRPILLDTNVLIWVLENSPRLSRRVKTAITALHSDVRVSVVSAWEIVLKFQAGKLTFDVPIEQVLSGILGGATWPVLPIQAAHVTELLGLPLLHRDPFDRLLIAQARSEGMLLATSDTRIHQYKVATLW